MVDIRKQTTKLQFAGSTYWIESGDFGFYLRIMNKKTGISTSKAIITAEGEVILI